MSSRVQREPHKLTALDPWKQKKLNSFLLAINNFWFSYDYLAQVGQTTEILQMGVDEESEMGNGN